MYFVVIEKKRNFIFLMFDLYSQLRLTNENTKYENEVFNLTL